MRNQKPSLGKKCKFVPSADMTYPATSHQGGDRHVLVVILSIFIYSGHAVLKIFSLSLFFCDFSKSFEKHWSRDSRAASLKFTEEIRGACRDLFNNLTPASYTNINPVNWGQQLDGEETVRSLTGAALWDREEACCVCDERPHGSEPLQPLVCSPPSTLQHTLWLQMTAESTRLLTTLNFTWRILKQHLKFIKI